MHLMNEMGCVCCCHKWDEDFWHIGNCCEGLCRDCGKYFLIGLKEHNCGARIVKKEMEKSSEFLDTIRYKKDGKSVLDNLVVNKREDKITIETMEIVSNCPQCGAPIYGQKEISKSLIPSIQYSCMCRNKSLESLTHCK